jgi:hypothetical protein
MHVVPGEEDCGGERPLAHSWVRLFQICASSVAWSPTNLTCFAFKPNCCTSQFMENLRNEVIHKRSGLHRKIWCKSRRIPCAFWQLFLKPFSKLRISPTFVPNASYCRVLQLAQKELGKMGGYKAPRDKLVCILNCCRVINNLLLNMAMAAQGNPPGADDFLPVLIYVVIKVGNLLLNTCCSGKLFSPILSPLRFKSFHMPYRVGRFSTVRRRVRKCMIHN